LRIPAGRPRLSPTARLCRPTQSTRGPTPRGIGAEGILYLICRAQEFRQHDRVFHRHAAALPHHRRTRMGGVADQHDTAAAPFVELQPFDRSAVNFLVLLQTGEILLYHWAKPSKAIAEPPEPALHRILQPRSGHVAKP